jgi:hypothetical protein
MESKTSISVFRLTLLLYDNNGAHEEKGKPAVIEIKTLSIGGLATCQRTSSRASSRDVSTSRFVRDMLIFFFLLILFAQPTLTIVRDAPVPSLPQPGDDVRAASRRVSRR